jgi:hypothetical protein
MRPSYMKRSRYTRLTREERAFESRQAVGQVYRSIWRDKRFQGLAEAAQVLCLRLILGGSGSEVDQVAEDLNWSEEEVIRGVADIIASGLLAERGPIFRDALALGGAVSTVQRSAEKPRSA